MYQCDYTAVVQKCATVVDTYNICAEGIMATDHMDSFSLSGDHKYIIYGIFLLACLLLLCSYVRTHVEVIRYPNSLPLIREPPGKRWFSLKTRLAYYLDCRNLYCETYETVT